MPLPQKVIEQLGREPQRIPGWAGQIVMFSGTIFFLSLVIYFGLAYGYKAYLGVSLKNLQDQIKIFSQKVPEEDQKKIISFYSQISNLKTVLNNHVFSSQLFSWLENNTQVNVYYDKFNLNVMNNKLVLVGIAKTMDDVNQELAIFQSRGEVSKVTVGNISSVSGAWRFEVTLTFTPGYFNRSSTASGAGASPANVATDNVTSTKQQ